jgi:Cupredoxin-like domain
MSVRSRGMVLALLIAAMAPAISAEPEFLIEIKNHQFIPAELRIPAGVKVQIVVDNQDDAPEEFESYSLNREKHIPPKSRITLFIGPLAAGRYVYQGEDRADGATSLGVIEAR